MAYNYPSQSLPASQMVPGPPFPDQGSGGGGSGGGSSRGSMPLLLAAVAIPGAGLEHDSAPAQYPLQQQQHYHHHHEHQQGLLQHPHHNHNHNHSQDQQLQGQELFCQHQQQQHQHQQSYQQQPHHQSHHQAQHIHHQYHHHEQQQQQHHHHHHHQQLPEPAQHPLHPLIQHHSPGQIYQQPMPTQLARNPFMSLSPLQDLSLSSRLHNSSPQQGQSFISPVAAGELHRHTDRDDIYSPGGGPASEQLSPGPDTPSSVPDDDAPDNPAPRAGPTPAEWESMKEVIADMYMTQRQPLKDVRPILRERYGFQPSARMFKRQFEKWNWSKYDSKRVRVRRELEALASTSPFETPPDPLVRSTRQSSKMRQLHQQYNHQLSASSSQQHLRQSPHTPQQSSASSSRSRLSPTPSSSTDPNPNPNLGPAAMAPAGAAGPLPPPAQNEYRAVVGGSESPYGVDVGSGISGSGGRRHGRRGGEVREVASRWQSRMGADVTGVGGWNDDIDLSLSWAEFVGGGGGSSAGSCGGNSSWGSFSGCRLGSEDEEDEVSLDRRAVSLVPLPLHQLQVGFFPERWGDMEMLVKPEPSDEGWNRILPS